MRGERCCLQAVQCTWVHGHVGGVPALGLALAPAHDEVGDEAQALAEEHAGALHRGVLEGERCAIRQRADNSDVLQEATGTVRASKD